MWRRIGIVCAVFLALGAAVGGMAVFCLGGAALFAWLFGTAIMGQLGLVVGGLLFIAVLVGSRALD